MRTRRNASKAIGRLPVWLHAFVVGVLTAALPACRGGRVPPDELVVLIEAPPQSPDPRFAVSAYDFKLLRLLYASLVSVDNARMEAQMELAESVAPVDDHTWEVTLREARFSDGSLVTSDDVAYTLEAARASGSRLRQRFLDNGLSRIETLGPRRLRFHLSHPHAPFVTDLDVGIMKRPPAPLAPGQLPTGAGPFVFAERQGESWRLLANPHYFKGAPRARAVTFKVIRDDNSRLLALVGGSGDLTQNSIAPVLIDAIAKQPRLAVETGRSSTYSYLGINCADPILKDVRVRRAIALAIDRSLLVETKLRGRAVLSTGMLPPFHWAYEPDVPRYDYDPARARALLDEAGHPDPDGDGPRTRFTLLYRTSNNRFRVAVAEAIADMLATVGIGVEIRVNEFATFFADVKRGNFQIFTMQIPEVSEPDLYTHFFSSTRVPTRENLDLGANRAGYRNAELDRLVEEGRREMDRTRRKAIYAEVQRLLARDVPVVSLWHEDNVVAFRRGVRGYELYPTAQLTSLARTYKE